MHREPQDPQEPESAELPLLIALVYLPTFLMYIGWGMILPIIPLYATSLGAGLALAGLVVSLRGAGPLLFNIPSGMLISRFGNRAVLIAATAVSGLTAVGTGLSRDVVLLSIMIFIMGGSQIVWVMSRLAFIRTVIPVSRRGRAISAIGGINRVGTFVGPIAGGFLGKFAGLPAVFYAQAVLTFAVLAMVLLQRKHREPATAEPDGSVSFGGIVRMFHTHLKSFLTVGVVTIAFGIVRSARQVVFPLWGDAIAIDVAMIGLIVGISSAIDMTLFYPAGLIMDKRGRKWAAVPSLLIMSAGLALLPSTGSFAGMLLVGLAVGFGNGLGSGIVMTLGTDLAPERNTGEFLGLWFLVANLGTMIGPLVIGVLAESMSLSVASFVTAGMGVAGAAFLVVFVQETLSRRR